MIQLESLELIITGIMVAAPGLFILVTALYSLVAQRTMISRTFYSRAMIVLTFSFYIYIYGKTLIISLQNGIIQPNIIFSLLLLAVFIGYLAARPQGWYIAGVMADEFKRIFFDILNARNIPYEKGPGKISFANDGGIIGVSIQARTGHVTLTGRSQKGRRILNEIMPVLSKTLFRQRKMFNPVMPALYMFLGVCIAAASCFYLIFPGLSNYILPEFPTFSQYMSAKGVSTGKVHMVYGYLDAKGTMAIPPKFTMAMPFRDGVAKVYADSQIGFIDRSGALLFTYASIIASLADTRTADSAGRISIRRWHGFGDFSEGLCGFWYKNKSGFVNRAGRVVIKPIYDVVMPFSEGIAAVSISNAWHFIDTMGTPVFRATFPVSSGDVECNEMINVPYESLLRFRKGICHIIIGDSVLAIDRAGKVVKRLTTAEFASGPDADTVALRPFESNKGLSGFKDRMGNQVIEPRFRITGRVFSEGLCYAMGETGETFGYIDTTGKFIIPPAFMAAQDFSEGLALVTTISGKWADTRFIDHRGKTAIAPPWLKCFQVLPPGFKEGYAVIFTRKTLWEKIREKIR